MADVSVTSSNRSGLTPARRPSAPAGWRRLLPLLRSDDTFADLTGLRSTPSSSRRPNRPGPIAVAGLAEASGRHPTWSSPCPDPGRRRALWPTTWPCFLGRTEVDVCPAWETLPFERVSPSAETMGRRLRASCGACAKGYGPPDAGVRSGGPNAPVAGRPGPLPAAAPRPPRRRGGARWSCRKGDQVDPEHLVARLVAMGYRREYQVEHRGELAVRGSIVDVYGSTADVPVRIDLWGDEVDRLTEFSVGDQRSTRSWLCVELFGCRELLPTDEVRQRAARLVGEAPWGREQWERLAEGQIFDGMESWLPWLTADDQGAC